jgi:cytochrome P450
MEAAGQPVDLVTTFALPFSSCTLCEILGVPHSERDEFERPNAIIDDPEASGAVRSAALADFSAYCSKVIKRKRVQPGDDLLSEFLAGGDLSDGEIAGAALLLFGAGHDTTANMVALSAFALLSDRAKWEALSADSSQLGVAVEELLRYLTIVQRGAFTRTALEDIDVDGVIIREGERVTVSLAAANRDPGKFDGPDVLDLARDATGHLAFGHGRHMCLGQHLVRLEMQVALGALIERFPTLNLAVPAEEVPFRSVKEIIYGVARLPVVW